MRYRLPPGYPYRRKTIIRNRLKSDCLSFPSPDLSSSDVREAQLGVMLAEIHCGSLQINSLTTILRRNAIIALERGSKWGSAVRANQTGDIFQRRSFLFLTICVWPILNSVTVEIAVRILQAASDKVNILAAPCRSRAPTRRYACTRAQVEDTPRSTSSKNVLKANTCILRRSSSSLCQHPGFSSREVSTTYIYIFIRASKCTFSSCPLLLYFTRAPSVRSNLHVWPCSITKGPFCSSTKF